MTERGSTTTSLYHGLPFLLLEDEDDDAGRGRERGTTPAELAAAVDRPEAGLVLVPARMLRWVVRYHLELRHVFAPVPHPTSYTFARDVLADVLRTYRISLRPDPGWIARTPEYVTLLARPTRAALARHGLAHFIREAWGHRLAGLVRFRVSGTPLATSIRAQRELIAAFGEARFEEARDVLDGEGLLVHPTDDGEVIRELAALFYRLRFFDPVRLKALLPSLRDDTTRRGLDGALRAAGVDPEAQLAASRPPDADPPARVVAAADRREAASRERARLHHDRDHRLARLLSVALGDGAPASADARDAMAALAASAATRLVEADGRLGRLDFAGLRNAAIAHGLDVDRTGILALDRALASEFDEHYQPAGWWQRAIVRWRAAASIAHDRASSRRARNTRRCLERIELELGSLARPTSGWRLAGRWLGWAIGRALLAGAAERVCRASEMACPAAQVAADYFRRARLRHLLDGARRGEDRHAARTLVLLRQASNVVAEVTDRDPGALAREVDRRMRLEYDLRSRPFARRLSARLGLAEGEHARVREVVDDLAHQTSLDARGVAAGLLLDLEASYLEGRRAAYAWNLHEWARSLGAQPARIPLPHAAELARLTHLRRALVKAEQLALPDEVVAARLAPIRDLARRTAEGLRRAFAPAVAAAMDAVLPSGLVGARERFARETIEAALVRGMVERGHSHWSDIRDVFSKNQLKLDDLAWRELVRGDLLSRLDRELARRLPGIHRPGELYLGAFQLLAAVAFGTPAGRGFCKLALFPGAIAASALTVLQLTVGRPIEWAPLEDPALVLGVSAALSLIANVRPLRQAATIMLWRVPRRVVSAIGALVARTPRRLRTIALYPAIGGQLTAWYLAAHWPALEHAAGRELRVAFPQTMRFAVGYVLAAAVINTRVGVTLAGLAAGVARVAIDAIGRGFLVRLYHLIIGLSHGLARRLERFNHAVASWLRSVEGETRAAVAAKALAGLVWAPVYYVFRAYVLLFLEPQVNPLKFPAVSVSYKLMIPIYEPMARTIAGWAGILLPTTVAVWGANAFTFFFCGIFGFLAWELKENWRLYRRNASATVKALPIGSHGETLAELLRPGFHSGPLPRLYRARRRAASIVPRSERAHAAVRALDAERDHVHEAISRFVAAELVRPLARHPAFANARVDADPAQVTSTGHAIGFTLRIDGIALEVELEERRGVLAAHLGGSVALLSRPQQHVLAVQYAYFCELASVDASRNAIELLLAREAHAAGVSRDALRLYDIEPGRLVVHADERRPRTFRGRLGSLWPSSGKRTFPLPDPYWLREHELAWSTYDALHAPGSDPVALGSKYLPLLGLVPAEGLTMPIAETPSTEVAAVPAPDGAAPPLVERAFGEEPPTSSPLA